MIQTSSTYFPFDGTCSLSCNGDITLIFEDKTSLKAHSALLKMASAVFDSMLTDCAKTKELTLEKTSRETWVHILNHLHPATTLVFAPFDPADNVDQLVSAALFQKLEAVCGVQRDLLEQARKFSLRSLFTLVDDALSTNFPKELKYNAQQTSAEIEGSTYILLYSTALQFELDLPRTCAKVSANVVQYLKSFQSPSPSPSVNTGQCIYCGRICSSQGYCKRCGEYSGSSATFIRQVRWLEIAQFFNVLS